MRTFPIFVSVDRKPPLVTGGGELAAIKARLLLKRAETVDIAADRLGPELAELERAGRVALTPAQPGVDQVRGRPLVIAATGDDEEDARVAAIARALGVPVNVPDKPALCSFVMPAIVDRGEVTVAIGTEGTSPVLAQRLRAWLERELHPRLDALARLAGDFRDAVAEKLPAGRPRRKFWEGVFDGAASEAALAGEESEARRLVGEAIEAAAKAQAVQGRVLLVGAGPGDPELLTLKAVRALKQADVILYDRLAGTGVLDHARREVELIPVGKAKGEHSVPQDKIQELMIERARAGQTVVRLKGGDPLVFGRAGEEIAALREAGIEVEIISGITAGLAAAASLQIPLTHRDISHSVTFISGHEAGGDEPSFEHLDLAALGKGESTLLVYMGVSTAGLIAHRLLDAGWEPACPVIAVENASRDSERRVSTTLAELAAAASLQIPLTHRDISHSVTFVSGHEAGGDEPSFEHLDLAALGKGESTLLVYMGVSTAGLIAHRLLDAGWEPACPVIAVENASRDSERRVATTLAELAAAPERLELKSPAVLIFGEIAGLPASGLVEDVLSLTELSRAYA